MKDVEQRNKKERTRFSVVEIFLAILKHRQTKKKQSVPFYQLTFILVLFYKHGFVRF